jgi:hypothetical protein
MDDTEPDPNSDEIPIEHALKAVARRLAGAAAAVDGFAPPAGFKKDWYRNA